MKVVISAGHSAEVRGATGYLDEFDENVRVTMQVAKELRRDGVEVVTFVDETSTSQDENLETIVNFHNNQGEHDLDVSVHFNWSGVGASGSEVYYVTQEELAGELSAAMAFHMQIPDRGAKYGNLYFLNNTREKAVLLEVCFVDNEDDADSYRTNFDDVCRAISDTIQGVGGSEVPERPERPERPDQPPEGTLFYAKGRCSAFGGPDDEDMDADEGLAFIYQFEDAPHLFLPDQPAGTGGLGRRLDSGVFYVACRWDYSKTPKEMLRDQSIKAAVISEKGSFLAFPADWGPNENTGRVADLSGALMVALDVSTDDEVEVIYPAPMP